jgi:hypothetical protein
MVCLRNISVDTLTKGDTEYDDDDDDDNNNNNNNNNNNSEYFLSGRLQCEDYYCTSYPLIQYVPQIKNQSRIVAIIFLKP